MWVHPQENPCLERTLSHCPPPPFYEWPVPGSTRETNTTRGAPFHKAQTYTIPNQVFDHIDSGQVQTLIDPFAELNHVWMVVDNSSFIWLRPV